MQAVVGPSAPLRELDGFAWKTVEMDKHQGLMIICIHYLDLLFQLSEIFGLTNSSVSITFSSQ